MKKKIWLPVSLIFIAGIYFFYQFFLIDFLNPYDKSFKDFVIKSSTPIENIDPKNSNYEGYEKIAAAIGDSKVVFLGEQDHGDAPTFLAKTKIIKYLHEKMGFNVLVFESNFLGLNQSLANQTDLRFSTREDYRDFIFKIWTNCMECTELFSYLDSIRSSSNPIHISGMDSRLSHSGVGPFPITHFIQSLANENLFSDDSEKESITKILEELVKNEYDSDLSSDRVDSLYSFFNRVENKLVQSSFLFQAVRSLRGFTSSALDSTDSNNPRDIQMSDNFLWLKKEVFPDEKIIVWASSYHLFKGFRDLTYPVFKTDTINAGTLIADEIEDELYILGFTSNKGKAGRLYLPKYDLKEPRPNYFEAFVEETEAKYAFLNFSNNDSSGYKNLNFWMKGLLHTPNYFYWTRMLDGVFYIEEMYPCSDVLNVDKYAVD
ncbi:erythromycin esterase family protein [Algoriphagus confluentis]|uniref:Erythromycin esterase n=1 Tax=Algoriphagus confluentis TaxID=1697556 RepID=A0ABQ6PMQ5_9BACT|nr:hypothetical protein Aconfl_18980 [Algoriphagus confluentis]